MKEILRFTAAVLLFVLCCWAWGPSGDPAGSVQAALNGPTAETAAEQELPAETPGTSGDPDTSEENDPDGPDGITESSVSGKDGWFVILMLGAIAAGGALALAFRGKKPKNMSKTTENPDTEPDTDTERTVRIKKDGPYECAACIGQGKRSYQEDSLWYSSRSGAGKPVCAIVADGMGGMDNGAESSSIAKEFFKIHIRSLETDRDIPSKLWEISSIINSEVYTANTKKNMNGGTTLVCAYIINNMFYWISIGDSRIYLYRDGMLAAVNEEHELETRLYDMYLDGKISMNELRMIPERELRKLTSHVGRSAVTLIDQNYVPYKLNKGDKIILCSDGVSGTLSEEDLLFCLQDPDPEADCRQIREMIEEKDRRGQDNYAAVVISCRTEDGK